MYSPPSRSSTPASASRRSILSKRIANVREVHPAVPAATPGLPSSLARAPTPIGPGRQRHRRETKAPGRPAGQTSPPGYSLAGQVITESAGRCGYRGRRGKSVGGLQPVEQGAFTPDHLVEQVLQLFGGRQQGGAGGALHGKAGQAAQRQAVGGVKPQVARQGFRRFRRLRSSCTTIGAWLVTESRRRAWQTKVSGKAPLSQRRSQAKGR